MMSMYYDYNFSDIQIQKIVELLNKLNSVNNSLMSNSKVKNVYFYTNDSNDFVCKYDETGASGSRLGTEENFVEIDLKGNERDLRDSLKSLAQAREYVSKMRQIKF